MARFVNTVQNHILSSKDVQQEMKSNTGKIFQLMKGSRTGYIKTLLDGEDQGHCKGIKRRMDPTTKYRIQQQISKQQQICEERLEEIRAVKKEKDEQKLKEKKERVQQRIKELDRMRLHPGLATIRDTSEGDTGSVYSLEQAKKKVNFEVHDMTHQKGEDSSSIGAGAKPSAHLPLLDAFGETLMSDIMSPSPVGLELSSKTVSPTKSNAGFTGLSAQEATFSRFQLKKKGTSVLTKKIQVMRDIFNLKDLKPE